MAHKEPTEGRKPTLEIQAITQTTTLGRLV